MLELTKTPRTDGTIRLTVTVPKDKAKGIATALEGILRLVGEVTEKIVPASKVLPDMAPGKVLRGARGLREMTQAQPAAALGIPKSNSSGMERDVRPIGKEMAKRLGKALSMPHRSFLGGCIPLPQNLGPKSCGAATTKFASGQIQRALAWNVADSRRRHSTRGAGLALNIRGPAFTAQYLLHRSLRVH